MDSLDNDGYVLLTEEKFDFDLTLSPASVKDEDDDDDEVFVGPVRHKEKCVSAGIEKQANVTESKTENIPTGSWSLISGDKFVEIFKEAHLLARQFEKSGDFVQPEKRTVKNEVVEKFVENSKAKLNMLHKAKEHVISPVKRETFCVWDSPLKQLPPVIQQRLISSNMAGSPSKTNASASSPAKVCKTQQQKQSTGSSANVCQKEKTLSYSKRIPLSKAVSSKATDQDGKNGHVAAEKPRKGIKSISRRWHNSSACSSEDLHSDNASIASDRIESSLNGSILGKITVSVSTKIGLQKSCGTKPVVQHRGVGGATRRNTSSSSSSLSSMNSSMNSSISVSPTGKGKTNTLVHNSLSRTKMQSSSSGKRLVPPVAGGRLHTSQVKKVPVVASKLVKSASAGSKLPSPARRVGSAATLQPHTPDSKEPPSSVLNVQSSAQQNKTTSDIKGSVPVFPKPKAFIAPTPAGYLKGPRYSGVPSPEAPRIMHPKRLMSCSNTGSTRASTTTDLSDQVAQRTPIVGARSVSVTSSVRRSSALPTPVSRRFSGIPVMTPRTLPRTLASSCRTSESAKVLLSDRRFSASPLQINEVKPQDRCQYDSLPSGQSPPLQMVPCVLDFSPEKPNAELHQDALKDQTVVSPTKPCDALTETQLLRSAEKETLLVDIEVDAQPSVPKMEDRPLIDLSNTPDLINKSLPLKPTVVGQLIDLSSPLLKFCPVARKENEVESPLIKFTC
ncbi:G2 and S phase-expressed protein 1-like isoform X2 [Polyodon spathula]|uniref:G2 and S phase-expressed protein 1-like isoform X2 n=1 Tax=Polyodon spathula TaxID=7913 RepID=UPI001B7F1D1F|nr:G2 and S phase-expressed protein 1-like isoform X2 [Polyodon spathula]